MAVIPNRVGFAYFVFAQISRYLVPRLQLSSEWGRENLETR